MKKLLPLLSLAIWAAAPAANANYTIANAYTGTATLTSNGACKVKRLSFNNAQFGTVTDVDTGDSFRGILSDDGQLLARFEAKSLVLTDNKASSDKRDLSLRSESLMLAPVSAQFFANRGCHFIQDGHGVAIVQTSPATNFAEKINSRYRKKTNDWLLRTQLQLRLSAHATTLLEQQCTGTYNCRRTGVVSTFTVTFRHDHSSPQPDRYFLPF